LLICLVYHKVLLQTDDSVHSVSHAGFVRQLSLVRKSGLAVVDPQALASRADEPSGIVLTFDDATSDHFDIVRPLLAEFGMRAIFYVPTATLDQAGYLTTSQLQTLAGDGHSIGSHSATHPRLTEVPAEQALLEMSGSAAFIEKVLGRRPLHFAPPGGLYNDTVQRLAQRAGYLSFRTMEWGYNRRLDPMRIEVVPMTERLGESFLKRALNCDSEWAFKLAFRMKRRFRTMQAGYGALQRHLAR
jgi:peptidoglycan/xylan/chitin deacetylase (PgdA/CDA1 family)